MSKTDLSDVYRAYIACLNGQDWPKLERFVHDEVRHNGQRIGLSGYREMLERDFHEIPDLHFNVHLLISDPPYIASRLGFDCTPKGKFLGLPVTGEKFLSPKMSSINFGTKGLIRMVCHRQGGHRSSALDRKCSYQDS
jgi:predicted ester cyclase